MAMWHLTVLLSHLCLSLASLAFDDRVPVDLEFPPAALFNDVEASRAALRESRVTLCRLSWPGRRESPASAPMFRDLVKASGGCGKGSDAVVVPAPPPARLAPRPRRP